MNVLPQSFGGSAIDVGIPEVDGSQLGWHKNRRWGYDLKKVN